MRDLRYSSIKKVLWVILLANFAVAVIKIAIGLACKSQSVIADGINSVADGSSNIVGLIGIWLAAKPRDIQHPYGHDKYEIIASMLIGVMLALLSVQIMAGAVASFQNPVAMDIDYIEVVLMIATIAINLIVATVEYRCGKKLESTILVTDSLLTRGNIMISCAVLLGLVGVKLGIPQWIDGAISLLVAIAVLIPAWQIFKNCVSILVDSTAVDGTEVKNLLMTVPGIYDVHQVRSRGESSHTFIDLHVVVNPQEDVTAAHALCHKMETILKDNFGSNTEVCIQLEPNDELHGQ